MRRREFISLLGSAVVVGPLAAQTRQADQPGTPTAGQGWEVLRQGGGGLITGMDIANDGSKVIRMDTGGSRIWNGSTWSQVLLTTVMPAGRVTIDNAYGVDEIVFAPNRSSILYMAYNGSLFKSTNKGATFAELTKAPTYYGHPGRGNLKPQAKRIAVDPVNPNIAYFGSPNQGVWRTSDGGNSWEHVTDLGFALPLIDRQQRGHDYPYQQLNSTAIDLSSLVVGRNVTFTHENAAANSSWAAKDKTITMGSSPPSWYKNGMRIYDGTNAKSIGIAASWTGTTLTIRGTGAAHASSGSTDTLYFYLPVPASTNNYIQIWGTNNPHFNQIFGTYVSESGTSLVIKVRGVIGTDTVSGWKIGRANVPGAGHSICFDRSGGAMRGATKNIYISTFGYGILRSTDAGASWTRLNTANMPLAVYQMKCDAQGNLYVTLPVFWKNWTKLFTYNGASNDPAWTIVTTPIPAQIVAVNPFTPVRLGSTGTIVVGTGGQTFGCISFNGGATWSRTFEFGSCTVPDGDVGWLGSENFKTLSRSYFSSAAADFDPKQSGVLYWTGSQGVYYFSPPSSGSGRMAVALTSQSKGIEELVATFVVAPPGVTDGPVLCGWDIPIFKSTDSTAYPKVYGPVASRFIMNAWDCDYAQDNTQFLSALVNINRGFSSKAYPIVDISSQSADGGKFPSELFYRISE